MNLLRQRLDKSRFIAFVVISFLIEINEDQTRLNQLSIDLEKLLPLESITLLEGIAFLFKRIAELQTIPYNRRIYDRCIQFLSNRLTPSAIQTAIIILSKLKPSENLGELANVLWSGIKFPNKMIQKMSVKLYFHCLSHFPNSDDLAKGMMSMCSFCIQENANNSETYGAFILIKTFVNHGFEIISEKFGDLFNSLANNLQKSHDYNFFEVFALMCEKYTHKAHEYMNIINDVLLSDWDLNDSRTCNYYVKIANLFPDDFGLLCYNRAQTVNDDSYFKLISVKFGDYSNEAEIIQKFKDSKLTESFINGAYNFLKAYPQYAFRFVPFLVSKTDDCLVSDNFMNAFFLISKFSDAPIFPFQKYWDPIFESLKSSELNIETKKYHVLALLSILHNEPNNQFDKLLDLVFTVQGDSKEVFATLLDNIDDQLLPLFMNDTLQIITSSLSINDSGIAANSIINLFIRLRKLSPLSTFNIFINLLNTLPNSYSQYSSYSEKKKLISTWDLILDGVGDILAPYAQSIYQFSIDLISSKLPLPKTFNDRINYRKIARDNIQIHILAMKCVEKLMKLQYPYDPQKIVDAVLKNLTYFFDESVQIATLNTLRSVFRCFGINKIDLVSLHQKLFNFMKVSKSETVLYSILSILGTIGPLDPITFHMSEKPKELLPLYDKAKREQCYLDFVMRYLLNQLKTSHESSVFLNAILYIFQFDAHKSSRYLSEIMTILEQLLNNGIADSVFHIIRSITLLVEIEIYPYATQIFKLLQPYLINSNFNLPALKALSALVFILKSSFQPIAVSTFSKVLDLMTNPLDFDSN
ncbi:hypothetical protein TRFO_16183 [Tritrichomonas foetus]|uniref:Serine/threonine-protein kinase TOR n=1 Tax=Tritrichomonas foetus TaxID=1144522 RepID=A0A1J4KQT8_9EUKA|nr:hypothetical protein TRFO_16183 [Tritrichomonas foetus]|eukprot:OHT13631.1 hypothetical protein TRFO_16183 [Tritrichomonas foetus]